MKNAIINSLTRPVPMWRAVLAVALGVTYTTITFYNYAKCVMEAERIQAINEDVETLSSPFSPDDAEIL